MKTILIISHSHDCHVVKMVDELAQLNWPFFVLYLDLFPRDYQLTQCVSNSVTKAVLKNNLTGQFVDFSDIGVVWNRKPAPFSFKESEMNAEELSFASQETEHALFSALYLLECEWFNHPKYLRPSVWKGEQLKRAKAFGFTVPDTIISNNPDEIRQFYQQHKRVVYKVLSDPFMGFNEWEEETGQSVSAVPTTEVSEDMLEDFDSLSIMPNQFQAYIDKAFELRVTVIGEEVYSAHIDSQSHPETTIDCRNFSVEIPYTAFQLPEEIKRKCVALVQSYQLNYAAIDLIVTAQNDYVFLENNPCGQYLFVENRIPELKLTRFLAQELICNCKEFETNYGDPIR